MSRLKKVIVFWNMIKLVSFVVLLLVPFTRIAVKGRPKKVEPPVND